MVMQRGATALHLASLHGHVACAEFLVSNGANATLRTMVCRWFAPRLCALCMLCSLRWFVSHSCLRTCFLNARRVTRLLIGLRSMAVARSTPVFPPSCPGRHPSLTLVSMLLMCSFAVFSPASYRKGKSSLCLGTLGSLHWMLYRKKCCVCEPLKFGFCVHVNPASSFRMSIFSLLCCL